VSRDGRQAGRAERFRRGLAEQRPSVLDLASGGVVVSAQAQVAIGKTPAPTLVGVRSLQRAARGRGCVGTRSAEQVRRVLAPLAAEGWRLRHSLRWEGRGDVDSVASAPTGSLRDRDKKRERSTTSISPACTRWLGASCRPPPPPRPAPPDPCPGSTSPAAEPSWSARPPGRHTPPRTANDRDQGCRHVPSSSNRCFTLSRPG
jgi:hypothetical protein